MKKKNIEILYKNMDSHANLLDAREAINDTIRSSRKALRHIHKSLEYSRIANKRISEITRDEAA